MQCIVFRLKMHVDLKYIILYRRYDETLLSSNFCWVRLGTSEAVWCWRVPASQRSDGSDGGTKMTRNSCRCLLHHARRTPARLLRRSLLQEKSPPTLSLLLQVGTVLCCGCNNVKVFYICFIFTIIYSFSLALFFPYSDGAGPSGAGGTGVKNMLIIDARSYASAVANRAKGGGCECQGRVVEI